MVYGMVWYAWSVHFGRRVTYRACVRLKRTKANALPVTRGTNRPMRDGTRAGPNATDTHGRRGAIEEALRQGRKKDGGGAGLNRTEAEMLGMSRGGTTGLIKLLS